MSRKKKRILPHLFRGRVIVAFSIVVQIGVLLWIVFSGAKLSPYIALALNAISLVISLVVIVRHTKDAYKLTWIYLILCFPVVGGLLYLVFSVQASMRLMEPFMKQIDQIASAVTEESDNCAQRALGKYPDNSKQISYLYNYAGFPIFDNTESQYYPSGENFYPALLEALQNAERYIFLEYFIISEGKMWDTVLDILAAKAQNGVDVRIIYDDFGCIFQLPKKYPEKLAEMGIECRAFNRFRPILTGLQNNRDHRKICVVDGKVAFTGGINLADEYINEIEKFGRWKDAAVRVTGDAAWSLTVIFMKNWILTDSDHSSVNSITDFRPQTADKHSQSYDGYVQPYCDSPLDTDHICEHVYTQIIEQAKRYLYIMTPYLIIDNGMLTSLTLAAKSGVDVRIITPHIWDKKLVHITTRSYYRELIEGGVKIYEYTPGFIHSKVMISDDRVASVGTANLDFRSLYLHFECGTMLYGSRAVIQAKEDFLSTIEVSQEITEKDCRVGLFMRFINSIMRLFAPLL